MMQHIRNSINIGMKLIRLDHNEFLGITSNKATVGLRVWVNAWELHNLLRDRKMQDYDITPILLDPIEITDTIPTGE
jgi:hypothetical protein